MKKQLIVAGVIGLLCAGQSATAKTLEDVLKEKGVITEEDYKEIVKSSPFKYKLGEGVNFTSADGKFSNSVGGMFQVRYTYMDLDDSNNTATRKAQSSSKFELKRIKLLFNGHAYSPDLTYKLSLNFSNITGGTTTNGGLMEEAWMNYRLYDELQFRIGQDKVQFARQWITPSTALQFVDVSPVTSAFAPGYDTGLAINGKVAKGVVNYSIAAMGGVGQNTFRTTTDNAFAARVVVNPLGDMKYGEPDLDNSAKPLVSVGANFYRDAIAVGETNNLGYTKSAGWYGIGSPLMPASQRFTNGEQLDFNSIGVDTAFKWQGLSVASEYFYAEAKGEDSTLRADGFYAQAGYFVIPSKVELAYRYSYLDPNNKVANDHWIENTVAASWYINKHNLKIQTDYTLVHKQAAIASTRGANDTDDNQLRFQVQMLF